MKSDGSYFVRNDGMPLHHRRWLTAGEPKAVLVLVHGLSEHSGRYDDLGRRLSQAGCAVRALDLRGHGLSGGDRAFVRSFTIHMDDVADFLHLVRGDHPNTPLFLFGQSMGGLIVALLAAERDLDVCGVVLSAPALRVSDHVAPMLRRMAGIASLVAPRLAVVRIRSAKLSRATDVVAGFESDPLVFHGYMPTRTAAEILRAAKRVQRRLEAVRLPFLAMHGSGDEVTDPEGSRQLYRRAASSDKTLKIYDGLWHDLFHEPEKEQVTRDLIDWLQRLATSGC